MNQFGVLLSNPKFPANVGAVLRVVSVFGGDYLTVTGLRCHEEVKNLRRLPREERMREYRSTPLHWVRAGRPVSDVFDTTGFVPVCVEVDPSAESLIDFEHPEKALYVFGPEDGSVPDGFRRASHRFVAIPSIQCLNLSTAVAIVAYDRMAKGL